MTRSFVNVVPSGLSSCCGNTSCSPSYSNEARPNLVALRMRPTNPIELSLTGGSEALRAQSKLTEHLQHFNEVLREAI